MLNVFVKMDLSQQLQLTKDSNVFVLQDILYKDLKILYMPVVHQTPL